MFSVVSSHFTLFNYNIKKLEIQPYLCLPLPKNLVFYLTKLRISAHQLYVETGRYCITLPFLEKIELFPLQKYC